MLFDAIGFYLQRVPYHIDMFLFISLLTKSGYSYSLQCHYNKTIPAAGLLFLITRFSTFQILLSETYFLRVLTEVFVSVIYKQQKKGLLVEGEILGLLFLLLAVNTLRKISNQLVNGNSAHIADGYECKHTEDHVHALNLFTEGRVPRLKFHVSATFVPMIERICYY